MYAMPRTKLLIDGVSSLLDVDGLSDPSGAADIPASTALAGGVPARSGGEAAVDEVTLRRAGLYLPVHLKFTLSLLIAMRWAAISYHLAGRWIADLTEVAGGAFAHCAIFSIAIIPGFMNAFLAAVLLLDR